MTTTLQDPATVPQTTLDKLQNVSTPTLSTALLKRGFRNPYMQGIMPLKPGAKMVGPAFTLRYIPAREDLDVVAAFREPDHPQRVAVETIPAGAVLVMDCRQDSTAASGGSILFTRLEVRGCAGVVTDAGVRDVEGIAALTMPTFCVGASAPTNLTKHHAVDIGIPIGCGGAPVYPGDIIVGDRDGVIVVPANIADAVADEGLAMEAFEEFAIQEIRAGHPVIGTYPPNEQTKARYKAYRAGTYQPGKPA